MKVTAGLDRGGGEAVDAVLRVWPLVKVNAEMSSMDLAANGQVLAPFFMEVSSRHV